MSWVLGPTYGDVVQTESDYVAEAKFLGAVGVVIGRVLFPYRSVMSVMELNNHAREMARAALIEFRKFNREQSDVMWIAVNTVMRHTLTRNSVSGGFLQTVYALKAEVVGDSVKVLADSGGVTHSRLSAYFHDLSDETVAYLLHLSAEVDFLKMLVGIRDLFNGTEGARALEVRLGSLDDVQIQFISLVLERGYTCQCAGRYLGLTTFEVSRSLRTAAKKILSI
ncbi:hypothetical protein [Vibrio owensii]|uniref:hypothetical protein n=1 Tax=Vibrio owensii TaxID=696485 RepID=UPI0018F1A565|nr:hypothetical protein [Vibrio owensii]